MAVSDRTSRGAEVSLPTPPIAAEKPFRSVGLHPPLRWVIRRWSPSHIWYRIRLPFRRRRWHRECLRATRGFAKAANPKGEGPALLVGDFSGVHGLSRGAAYDRDWLRETHPDLDVVDIGPALRGKLVAVDRTKRYGTVYLFCQPDNYSSVFPLFAPEQFADARRIGRWVWETPLFPQSWRFALHLVHEIWTPSEFCAETFRKATDMPVVVVPHHVPPPEPDTGALTRADLGISEDAFVGLAIMDIQSCPARKNPWAHIEAWQLAFGNDPKAVLVMKVRVGKRTRIVLEELRELGSATGNVRLITDDLSEAEIISVRAFSNVFVSLHRAEGYGLNIHEALRTEKDVICTGCPTSFELFANYKNFKSVLCGPTRCSDWLSHYSDSGFAWCDASISDASQKLREARFGALSGW